MAENWLQDTLTTFGTGMINQLPMLIRTAPQLMSSMLPEGTPPVVTQIATGMLNNLWGMGLDALTGTSKSDIRASDYLNNPTARSLLLAREARRTKRNLGSEFAQEYLESAAKRQTEDLARSIYGDNYSTQMDSWGYKIIESGIKSSREESAKTTARLIAEATFRGQSLGGVDFSAPVNMSKATLDAMSPEQRAITEQQMAQNRAAQQNQAAWMTRAVDRAFFGGLAEDGVTRVGHVSGSLSRAEVAQLVSEFSRNGGFSGSDRDSVERDLRNYVQRIATGVDNVKQVLGSNTTSAQAQAFISGMYGFNVASNNPAAFNAITANIRDIAARTGMTPEELGNAKSGYVGLMTQSLAGLGIKQHAAATMGVMLGALNHGQESGIYGMSSGEHAAMTAQRLRYEEISGVNEDSSIALLAWADRNGKDITNLTDADRANFLKDMAAAGVDLADTASVRRYAGSDMYSAYRGSTSAKVAFDSNAKLWAQAASTRSKEVYSSMREDFRNGIGDSAYSELKQALGGQDIFNQSAYEVESAIRNLSSVDADTKAEMLRRYKSSVQTLEEVHNLGAKERIEFSQAAVRDSLISKFSTADPVAAMQQYANAQKAAGKEVTLTGFVSAFMGMPVSSEAEAMKILKDGIKSEELGKFTTKAKELTGKAIDTAKEAVTSTTDSSKAVTKGSDEGTTETAKELKVLINELTTTVKKLDRFIEIKTKQGES